MLAEKYEIPVFFFFLRECFKLWHLHLIIVLYHQIKTLISFWCKWEFLIQSSEILPIELIRTHIKD